MKFSFISPSPNIDLLISEKKKAIGSWPPLGILYIASVLQNHGIEVSVLDQAAKRYSLKDTVDWVRKEEPDILGFSTLISSSRTAALIAKEVKEENPNITTVFGNFHATFNAERILANYPFADIIVRGEGEETSLELAKCLKKGNPIKTVLGVTFRNKNHPLSTPDRPLIKDVNSIPFPDRDLLDVEYHSTIVGANVAPKKFTSILSSRGCVYRCRFCGCTKFARNRWRPRSAENTLKELELLVSKGYRQFLFVDDSFTMNPKRVIEICRGITKEKMDIQWICEGRVDHCSYDMLRAIAKAGCRVMYFGVESANQRILDYYRKQTTPEQAEKATKTARKAGIEILVGSFIVGAPSETRREIANTLKFPKKLGVDVPQFNILGAFPGNDVWEDLKVKGSLDEEKYWETGVFPSAILPDTVPYEEIKQMIHAYFHQFFINPKYLLTEVARTIRSSYRINVVISNLNRISDISESIRQLT
jgi:anaerobic magnesium-protoporphyrin IX monomethyl ester cyclase